LNRQGSPEELQSLFDSLSGKSDKGLIQLTKFQRGVEWHVLRKFALTSRSIHGMLSVCFRYFPILVKDTSKAGVSEALRASFQLYRKSDPKENVNQIPKYSREGLEQKKVMELKAECKLYNLVQSGNKPALINRLLENSEKFATMNSRATGGGSSSSSTEAENNEFIIEAAMFSSWFMAPLTTGAMAAGLSNEGKTLNGVPGFLREKSDEPEVAKLWCPGLLCDAKVHSIATSVDGIGKLVLYGRLYNFQSIYCLLFLYIVFNRY
jgi:hypothetical protein